MSSGTMGFIGRLYDVESDAREHQQVGEVLLARRQSETRSILDEFKLWLDAESRRALPKSAYGKAVRYTRRHWDALNTFVDDPRVPPDNNLSERCLRTIAVGRNNYMFAGSDRGARTAAALYTVVMSCKMQGLDPYAYLADVFDRLCVHSTNRIRAVDIDTLLPGTWEPRTQQ